MIFKVPKVFSLILCCVVGEYACQNIFASVIFNHIEWDNSTYDIEINVSGNIGTVYRCNVYATTDSGTEYFFVDSYGNKFNNGSITPCTQTNTCYIPNISGGLSANNLSPNIRFTTQSGQDPRVQCVDAFQIFVACDFVSPYSNSLTIELITFGHTCPFG